MIELFVYLGGGALAAWFLCRGVDCCIRTIVGRDE